MPKTQNKATLDSHCKGTVLEENIKIPLTWRNVPKKAKTRTELKQMQRNEFVPDISYDIDGDGSVGTRDFVSIFAFMYLGFKQTF